MNKFFNILLVAIVFSSSFALSAVKKYKNYQRGGGSNQKYFTKNANSRRSSLRKTFARKQFTPRTNVQKRFQTQIRKPISSFSSATPVVSPVNSAPSRWFNIPGAIYFYSSGQPYYEFTNFYQCRIDLDGKIWPSTEHYFQAQKFSGNPSLQEQIRKAPTARSAFNLAKTHAAWVRPNWNSITHDVMLRALRAKFNQHPSLKHLLKNTGHRILVENAGANDSFWGAGADGNGKNHLGELLMRVRSEIR